MIRVVLFLIAVGLIALGAIWIADRPGEVVVTWQGLRIETSLMVLGAALVAAMAVLALVWSVLRAIVRSPLALSRMRRRRRGARAYAAISSGLIAVGSGDAAAASKLAAEVKRIAPHEPLALLLGAQAAQLAGDRDAAEHAFRTMAGRHDTKTLGLHGLFVEARRRNDHVSAQAYAEEAARTAPALGWAGRAVLEFRSIAGDWAGALAALERHGSNLDKATYRRQRAVLLTARAQAVEDSDRDAAKSFAFEANTLAPTLVPAAVLAARFHAEAGAERKARRIIERAWTANPHPALAQAHSELRSGEAARDRLKRIEALAKKVPDHIEGALAVTRAALDAREFARARAALAPYLQPLTRRVALLMAEIERAEKGDEGRAREWIARAVHAAPDPVWTADGHVSDHWLPASPATGRLDAFEWRVPLAGSLGAPVIEPEPPAVIAEVEKDLAQPSAPEPSSQGQAEAAPAASTPASHPEAKSADVKAEPVIPLVHAPDDPGPEAVDDSETPIDRDAGWRKILG